MHRRQGVSLERASSTHPIHTTRTPTEPYSPIQHNQIWINIDYQLPPPRMCMHLSFSIIDALCQWWLHFHQTPNFIGNSLPITAYCKRLIVATEWRKYIHLCLSGIKKTLVNEHQLLPTDCFRSCDSYRLDDTCHNCSKSGQNLEMIKTNFFKNCLDL
jgi:hypothetical protein